MTLLKFKNQTLADEFYNTYNSMPYNSIEDHLCQLAYVAKVPMVTCVQFGNKKDDGVVGSRMVDVRQLYGGCAHVVSKFSLSRSLSLKSSIFYAYSIFSIHNR